MTDTCTPRPAFITPTSRRGVPMKTLPIPTAIAAQQAMSREREAVARDDWTQS